MEILHRHGVKYFHNDAFVIAEKKNFPFRDEITGKFSGFHKASTENGRLIHRKP